MNPVGVGFDIDHTLCIDNKLERVALLHVLERVVNDGGHALGTLQQEIEHIDGLLSFQRGGGCSVDDAVLRFVTERGGAPHAHYVEGFKEWSLAMAETFIITDPDAKATIESLAARGVPVGVLSNGWNPLQVAKARRAGFTGKVLASADLGVQKPHPKAFHALANELGLAPAQCFYVGDDPKGDIAGALSAGFRAVWLDNEGKTYPADLPAPTHVATSLLDVLGLVAAAAS